MSVNDRSNRFSAARGVFERPFSFSIRESLGPADPALQRRSDRHGAALAYRAASEGDDPDRAATAERAEPARRSRHRRSELLSASAFAEQLRREMQRTNRSGSSFAVVVFTAERNIHGHRVVLNDLSRLLQVEIRATDILGWCGPRAVAVLLSHTGSEGARHFADRILAGSGGAPIAVETTQYPGQTTAARPPETAGDADSAEALSPRPRRADAAHSPGKRILDVLGVLIAAVLLSPVMLVTAAAVKATSPGPVIYRQTRLGFEGKPFTFLKFRSMRVDADDELHRQYTERFVTGQLGDTGERAGEGSHFKITSDPRLTPIGNFIRKTSIDELPQLLNVLKGEMSLVGPRPPLPYEVDKYKPWHLRRILDVRPGMTGLWQVEGRSTTTFDEMVRLDLHYVDQWSIWLDLKILIKTIKVVVTCRGAF